MKERAKTPKTPKAPTKKIPVPQEFIPGVFIGTTPEGNLKALYYRPITGGGQDIGELLGLVASDMVAEVARAGHHNERWVEMQKQDLVKAIAAKLALTRVESSANGN